MNHHLLPVSTSAKRRSPRQLPRLDNTEVAILDRPGHNNFLPPTQKISITAGALSETCPTDVSLSETCSDQEPSMRVDSWKHIAHYFCRDIRTVQRWERQEGLPVHRHSHRKSSSVYAIRRELHTWWSSRDVSSDDGKLQSRRCASAPPRSTQNFPKDNSEENVLQLFMKQLMIAVSLEVKSKKAKRKAGCAAPAATFPGSDRPASRQHHTPRVSLNY